MSGYPFHAWTPSWSVAAASVIGTSHVEGGLPCQDRHHVEVIRSSRGGEVLVACVADGAGSASHGGEGAELLCGFLRDRARELFRGGGLVRDLTPEQGAGWLDAYREAVDGVAEAGGGDRRDYASTLLFAAVGRESAAMYQIGDGAMAVGFAADPGSYVLPMQPERGEYANVTFFATDPDAPLHLQSCAYDEKIEEIALFTDGVESVAVRSADGEAHGPFFDGVFPELRRAPRAPAKDAALSGALGAFLASDRLSSRTDDDKTLVLASRRRGGDSNRAAT